MSRQVLSEAEFNRHAHSGGRSYRTRVLRHDAVFIYFLSEDAAYDYIVTHAPHAILQVEVDGGRWVAKQ